MFNYTVQGGIVDFSVVIRIVDSTDGTPELGVLYNTAGMALQYRRELAANVAITEATLAALTTAHADGGFLEIGNGYYRLDLPDAAVAAGVKGCLVHGIVTGMVVIGCYIEIVSYNPLDTIRLGLTALPNAAAEAAGGLYTRGTGAGQINQANNGQVDANAARTGGTTNTGRDIGASVLLSSGTGTGQVKLASGYVAPNWGDVGNPTTTVGLSGTTVKTATDIATLIAALNNLSAAGVTAAVWPAQANGIVEATFAADTAKYQGKLDVIDDDGGTTDRWISIWFKNGQPVTTGITSPTIQVIKVADGTDLIASTAMTQIASTGMYRYSAVTTERMTSGVAYIAKMTATIDGATRTWLRPIGRDS